MRVSRQSISESARSLLSEGSLIEEYAKHAQQYAPRWIHAHYVLAALAVNHAIRNARIPMSRGGPRIYALLLAPTSAGKGLTFSIAESSIIPEEWLLHISIATPEGLAEALLDERELPTPPIIAMSEFGQSLATEYSRIQQFILESYDGRPWISKTKTNPIRVPAHRTRISFIGMTVPDPLLDPDLPRLAYRYAISGLMARMILLTGDIKYSEVPDYIKPRREFAEAVMYISQTPIAHSQFRMHTQLRGEIAGFVDEIHSKYPELRSVFGRLGEQAVKLATAFAASRLEDTIEEQDIENAIEILGEAIPPVAELVADMLSATPKEARKTTVESRLYRILRERAANNPIPLRDVYRSLHVRKAELIQLIDELEDEDIRVFWSGSRNMICYRADPEKCESCPYKRQCSARPVVR